MGDGWTRAWAWAWVWVMAQGKGQAIMKLHRATGVLHPVPVV